MTDDLMRRVKRAAEVLVAAGAREVYLFGSSGTGNLRADSDIDLAVTGLPPEVFYQAMGDAEPLPDILPAPEGWREELQIEDRLLARPSATDIENGYVLFVRHYLEQYNSHYQKHTKPQSITAHVLPPSSLSFLDQASSTSVSFRGELMKI